MGVIHTLTSLRAVRRFADRQVPREALADILEAARWTGSSKNFQPWELVVVREKNTLAELASRSPNGDHLAEAAMAVVQVTKGTGVGPSFDAGRQAERLMLAAWAHGVGSCIASIFPARNQHSAKDLLGIPRETSVRTAISFGYPASKQARFLSVDPTVLRFPLDLGRMPLDSLVNWERYGLHR